MANQMLPEAGEKAFSPPMVAERDAEAGIVESITPSSQWGRFVPGPSPTTRAPQVSPKLLAILITTSASAALMLSGYNLALFGGMSSHPSYLEVVGMDPKVPRDQLLLSLVTAMYFIGVIIGALICGHLSDQFGRRKAVVCGAIIAMIAVPMLTATQNYAWTMIFRILNGVATGVLDAAALTWTAEIASSRQRGHLVGALLCSAALGASLVYFMLYGLTKNLTGSIVWRLPIAFQLVFVLTTAITPFLLPESPRWLVKVGMLDAAREVLLALHAEERHIVEDTLSTIICSHQDTLGKSAHSGYLGMLFLDGKSTARRTWSALFIQFGNQAFIGASFVAGYSGAILSAGGWSPETASVLGGVAIISQCVGGVFGVSLADRMGRRPAMLIGAFFGALVLALIGMCGYFVTKHEGDTMSGYSYAALALFILWSLQFGVTWLWCSFTYPAEIFPLRYRARGSSFSIMGFASGAFFCNMISQHLFDALGYKTMFLIAGWSVMIGLVCLLTMPETAKLSLEEIDVVFEEKLLQI